MNIFSHLHDIKPDVFFWGTQKEENSDEAWVEMKIISCVSHINLLYDSYS